MLFVLQPGNFLLDSRDTLLLNDFDLSATADDDSNDGFVNGTPRFRSPFLDAAHRYCTTDDKFSLVFTVVELVRSDLMDAYSSSPDLKHQLLNELLLGRHINSAALCVYIKQLLSVNQQE